jgi:hypothetical protein
MLQDRDRLVRARGRLQTRWVLGKAIVALTSFVAVWVPSKTVALGHPEDLAAVKTELARGPCFGSCQRYTITVQGDGRVEYSGRRRYSRFDSRKVGKIEREKITQILQTSDQVKFMTLDDWAFSWGFDTPSGGTNLGGWQIEASCQRRGICRFQEWPTLPFCGCHTRNLQHFEIHEMGLLRGREVCQSAVDRANS